MHEKETIHQAIQIFREQNGWLRTSQALQLGISPRTLYELRDSGIILQRGRGLYQLAEQPIGSNQDLVLVAQSVPRGVICLLSALAFYELTTQIPHQVYLALPNRSEKPRLDYPPLRIFWLSERVYEAGIEERMIEAMPIRIYSPEKSVADAFKFRNKIGVDIALEALKNYRQTQSFDIEALLTMARIDRVEKVMRPYLESIL